MRRGGRRRLIPRAAVGAVMGVLAAAVAAPATAATQITPQASTDERSAQGDPIGTASDRPVKADNRHDAADSAATHSARARQAAEPMPLQELVSAGGTGRMYTLDLAEASKAARSKDMTRTARQIAFIPRGKVDGSRAMYRLKPSKDATAWLSTTSASERDRLVSRGWVNEGITGYVPTEPKPGMDRLVRLSNGKEWRLALGAQVDSLKQNGYTVDGTLGYATKQNVRAGAVYFGMYNADGHQRVMQRTEEVYGRKGDWWGGVRDFHNGHPYGKKNWPDEDFSYLKPAIGYYDDSKPETVEKHIRQATSAGLDFFNFYWYWNAKDKSESTTNKALDAFLAAKNRDSIDFSIGLCAHPDDGLKIPQDQFGDVSRVLVDKYLSQDNALRANDGRKIVNICDARGIGDGSNEQIAAFTKTLRERAQDKLGEPIYVMINQGGFDPRNVPDAGGDAAYCTTDGPAVESQSYEKYLDGQRAFFDAAPGAYGRCAMSNFDERPRYPIETTELDDIRWMPDQSMAGFRSSLRNVRTDIAESERPAEVDNFVYLYAWNEWHEGGMIEPSERDGCAYLDAVREELDLTQGGGCIAQPKGGS